MEVRSTSIPEVKLVTPKVFSDARGYFKETWNRKTFADAGLDVEFVQDNQSRSARGVLRGLHYQIPRAQGKLVSVLEGCIFDVAVDLRRASPTFGRWAAEELSAANHGMLWIPPGFAHGFLVLSETADIAYKCTALFAPEDERTIRWDDPDLDIRWPVETGATPVVSARDAEGMAFRDAEVFP